jgi:isochorismate synthase
MTKQLHRADQDCDLPLFVGGFGFLDSPPSRDGVWSDWDSGMLFVPRHIVFERRAADGSVKCGVLTHRWASESDASESDAEQIGVLAALTNTNGAHAALKRRAEGVAREQPAPGRRGDFEKLVSLAIDAIRHEALDKVVIATTRDLHTEAGATLDAGASLVQLLRQQPGSHVFGFDRGEAGSFVGASPETLVEARGAALTTHAVAGTTTRGANPARDEVLAQALLANPKERNEHGWVVRGIVEKLAPLCRDMTIAPTPQVMALPTLQHLSTAISGTMNARGGLLDVIAQVHPSPALCGFPIDKAHSFIAAHEKIDRGWYGGPIGWIAPDGSGHFAVAIRAALLRDGRATAFGGAGVVAASNPQQEWRETQLKIDAIARCVTCRESTS